MESHDWQISCKNLNERGTQLLLSGQWTDCTFLVGSESNQVTVKGHKLFLAMASPVFEAMFYGGIPERNDPISILDVQPEAFKALLEYIYTDYININSFDKACELCYAAKKYMLPHLVKECTNFLWSDLHPKNACRAYEFAKLFEEPVLMKKCIQIICTRTPEVLAESSFEDIELGTLIMIFEQDNLNIDSELELFDAAVRYVNAQSNVFYQPAIPKLPAIASPTTSVQPTCSEEMTNVATASNSGEKSPASTENSASMTAETPKTTPDPASSSALTIRNAIQKIRFLTLTPQQFAEGPARSNLLQQSEAFSILMNISSPLSDHPMPEGFSTSKKLRQKKAEKEWMTSSLLTAREKHPNVQNLLAFSHSCMDTYEVHKYCRRTMIHTTDCLNTNVLDCSVNFTVDRNIGIIGVQVPTQVLGEGPPLAVPSSDTYPELLYAHLLDADGSRLTYTHYTMRVSYSSLLDIMFNRPFFIQRNKVYKIGVVFNKYGWYPMGTGCQRVVCDSVTFNFGVGQTSDCIRDGLIRSIIFAL